MARSSEEDQHDMNEASIAKVLASYLQHQVQRYENQCQAFLKKYRQEFRQSLMQFCEELIIDLKSMKLKKCFHTLPTSRNPSSSNPTFNLPPLDPLKKLNPIELFTLHF